jgi:hypothetical protein
MQMPLQMGFSKYVIYPHMANFSVKQRSKAIGPKANGRWLISMLRHESKAGNQNTT